MAWGTRKRDGTVGAGSVTEPVDVQKDLDVKAMPGLEEMERAIDEAQAYSTPKATSDMLPSISVARYEPSPIAIAGALTS